MNKNRFLAFLFSLMPGCGLMYLGYMKKGLQIMLAFAAVSFIGGFFASYSMGWLGAFFFMLLPVLWFYQMFDAIHTVTRMKNQGVELPTDDGFYLPDKVLRFSAAHNRTGAKIIAGILIVTGSISLIMGVFNNLWRYPGIDDEVVRLINDTIRYNLAPAIISIVLIAVGVTLLKGDKKKKSGNSYDKEGDLP